MQGDPRTFDARGGGLTAHQQRQKSVYTYFVCTAQQLEECSTELSINRHVECGQPPRECLYVEVYSACLHVGVYSIFFRCKGLFRSEYNRSLTPRLARQAGEPESPIVVRHNETHADIFRFSLCPALLLFLRVFFQEPGNV